ncbi:hypothetical protein C0075_05290 [Rhizobium sp. KAs_5_22]|nr:hypothetical protein C0075_05290 [Rhizobium sp. KAs_5_22]
MLQADNNGADRLPVFQIRGSDLVIAFVPRLRTIDVYGLHDGVVLITGDICQSGVSRDDFFIGINVRNGGAAHVEMVTFPYAVRLPLSLASSFARSFLERLVREITISNSLKTGRSVLPLADWSKSFRKRHIRRCE